MISLTALGFSPPSFFSSFFSLAGYLQLLQTAALPP
jgi:hypothetical protein